MNKQQKLENFYAKDSPWKKGVNRLRHIILKTELSEDWKWSFPTYTLNGKNVLGVASFKHHFGIWFFQGVFLKDKDKLLENAQEGKTKAMRSLKLKAIEDLNEVLLLEYITEAIQNSKDGKEIKPDRSKKELHIPDELANALLDPQFKESFYRLSPGKQREYADHIASAKQESTRLKRLDKSTPLILEGKGLHDKYKKK